MKTQTTEGDRAISLIGQLVSPDCRRALAEAIMARRTSDLSLVNRVIIAGKIFPEGTGTWAPRLVPRRHGQVR